MSPEPEREGWAVPLRAPLLAAAALLSLLLAGLLATGHLYRRELRASTHAPFARYPSPRLETIQTPPHQPRPDFRQPPPKAIGAAMREVVAGGDALWHQGK